MKYTALTVGPIYKTFMKARKTRELWAASYLFSYLMKKLIIALKVKDNNIEIIIPFTDDNLLNAKNETGLFPDRLVVKSNLPLSEIKTVIDNQLELLADAMSKHINDASLKDYFKNYFQVYAVEKDFADSTLKREVVKGLFDTLDILELQQKFVQEEPANNIQTFLSRSSFKKDKQHSFLMQDARELNNDDIVKFQSLIEISAIEIIKKFRR